jgi:hypothetical protein
MEHIPERENPQLLLKKLGPLWSYAWEVFYFSIKDRCHKAKILKINM